MCPSQFNNRPRRAKALLIWLLILFALPLAGCGGCSDDSPEQVAKAAAEKKKKEEEEAKKKKEQEKKKPDFDILQASVVPSGGETPSLGVKPGHWLAITQGMKTNNFDFIGEMHCELSLKASEGRMPQVDTHIASSRPAVLPKGQQKYFELPVFVPHAEGGRPWVTTELRSRGGGSVIQSGGTPLNLMPPYQFYFFVLAREPIRYRQSLDRLDALRGPLFDGRYSYYKLIVPGINKHFSLPAHPLAWTSIAYVLWDDVDPSQLSPDQQKAMLDWLHWGGQLILSGPGTLTTLRGSFLAPYLPAGDGGSRDVTAENLAPLSDFFTPSEGRGHRPLKPIKPLSGVQLTKASDAEFVPHSGDLVVERNVGRGRIVVTAFRLSLRALQDWPGFDSFFNSCLLRHLPRDFVTSSEGIDPARAQWLGHADRNFDARLTSDVRYISRDMGMDGTFLEDRRRPTPVTQYSGYGGINTVDVPIVDDEETYGAGVCGWSDDSAVSTKAHESLTTAAGIDIPRAGFVAWMLGAYLVVLVPVNWAIFRLLRRVEWAWVAVPILALAGAVVVTKAANLNIGFARSQTEIGLLEIQPGYARGHLTRYTAFYTSLSTNYDVRFDDPYAVVQPLEIKDRTRDPLSGPDNYTLRHEADVQLGGFSVSSNSTRMLHSEQMIDLGGAITYSDAGGPPTVVNRTSIAFDQASVVRLTGNGDYEAAWLGPLSPGEAGRPLRFETVSSEGMPLSNWADDPTAEPGTPQLSLRDLAKIVVDHKGLKPGEVRLIGSISRPLPGMDVDPVSSQATRSAVLIVAQLRYAHRPDPQPDHGSRADSPFKEPEERPEKPDPADPANNPP